MQAVALCFVHARADCPAYSTALRLHYSYSSIQPQLVLYSSSSLRAAACTLLRVHIVCSQLPMVAFVRRREIELLLRSFPQLPGGTPFDSLKAADDVLSKMIFRVNMNVSTHGDDSGV